MGMGQPKRLRIYLPDGMRQSASAGEHNFIKRITAAVEAVGYSVEIRPDSGPERLKSAARRGFSLFHMHDPFHDRALTMRRAYHYPFWGIEPSAKRWEWHVAQTPFDANRQHPDAARFVSSWRNRLFADATLQDTGHVYVPLQGKLLEQRSFQAASPLRMIEDTLAHTDRPVVATLHPSEVYEAKEIAALNQLAQCNNRLTVDTGHMMRWLAGAAYVVTQNSSAAFNGYFFGRPAILYGKVDFHHIALSVRTDGVAACFEHVEHHAPDFEGYLHWFWQEMSINAGRPDAEDKIRAALGRAGWPL